MRLRKNKRILSEQEGSLQGKDLFISHCSDDALLIRRFIACIEDHIDADCFNTSIEKHSTTAGQEREAALRAHLKQAGLMIAMVTDSYVRSVICISEISSFWFMNKRVLPFVFNGQTGVEFLNKLFGKDLIYLDANGDSTLQAEKLYRSLQELQIPLKGSPEQILADFREFFTSARAAKAVRPYIGSRQDYERINRYCDQWGVLQMKNTPISSDYRNQKLENADEILVVTTTGISLISNLCAGFLEKAIANGTDFTLLLPNLNSPFVLDVAEIEMPESPESNADRLAGEFRTVLHNLHESVVSARRRNDPAQACGHVYAGSSFTLLRQTILLGRHGSHIWGSASLTIPPKKTRDGTPTLEFEGNLDEDCFARAIYEHVCAIRNIARSREGSFLEITPDCDPNLLSFGMEKKTAREFWQKKMNEAVLNSLKSRAFENRILIEAAAQHPLNPDGTPGKEFAARLEKAAQIYREKKSQGGDVQIYVPGSLHQINGRADPCSLCASGIAHLKKLGIPTEDLIGEKANARYKGKWGVYNSADECYVASRLFQDGGYGQLYCVCSPNQLERKKMFYLAFGLSPMMISVPVDAMFHDPLKEWFETIPNLLYTGDTGQSFLSPLAEKSRAERMPDFDEEAWQQEACMESARKKR